MPVDKTARGQQRPEPDRMLNDRFGRLCRAQHKAEQQTADVPRVNFRNGRTAVKTPPPRRTRIPSTPVQTMPIVRSALPQALCRNFACSVSIDRPEGNRPVSTFAERPH